MSERQRNTDVPSLDTRVDNWSLRHKAQILAVAVLVALTADALTSWLLMALGVRIQLPFSVLSGVISFIPTVLFILIAHPRGWRHLFVICGGVFAATAVALVASTLATSPISVDTINYKDRQIFGLSALASMCIWLLLSWVLRKEALWDLWVDDNKEDGGNAEI